MTLQCTVELYGVARTVARTKEVSLTLPSDATVAHALEALGDKLPSLVGKVIQRDCRRLVEGYACNVNGRAFVRDMDTRINAGDAIVILSADAGG